MVLKLSVIFMKKDSAVVVDSKDKSCSIVLFKFLKMRNQYIIYAVLIALLLKINVKYSDQTLYWLKYVNFTY